MKHVSHDSQLANTHCDPLSGGLAALALGLSVALTTAAAAWPKAGAPVGVVFPPWVQLPDTIDRVVAAGGTIIDFGGAENVVIAIGPQSGFFGKLVSEGALVVLDGRLTSALCLTDKA